MRVHSWNMYCYNKRFDEVLASIQAMDGDIICLQEVPDSLLGRLRRLGMHIASAVDSEPLRQKKVPTNYNVILSRYPIRSSRRIALDHIPHPRRTRMVITLMRPVGWRHTKNRNALVATIATPLGPLQVYCAHLTLSSPSGRASEFARLLEYRDSKKPAIIAGDFNVLERPRVKPLSWFLGATLRESLPTYPERRLFEERFKNAQFKNPLKGRVTHDFSNSQLDHVLVSDQLSVTSSGVHPHLYGSDHYPVYVDIRA